MASLAIVLRQPVLVTSGTGLEPLEPEVRGIVELVASLAIVLRQPVLVTSGTGLEPLEPVECHGCWPVESLLLVYCRAPPAPPLLLISLSPPPPPPRSVFLSSPVQDPSAFSWRLPALAAEELLPGLSTSSLRFHRGSSNEMPGCQHLADLLKAQPAAQPPLEMQVVRQSPIRPRLALMPLAGPADLSRVDMDFQRRRSAGLSLTASVEMLLKQKWCSWLHSSTHHPRHPPPNRLRRVRWFSRSNP